MLQTLLNEGSDRIAALDTRLPMRFRFEWRAIPFEATIERADGGIALKLVASLGDLPFSAHSGAGRRQLLGLSNWHDDGQIIRFSLDGRRRLLLTSRHSLGKPLSPQSILTAVTTRLLAARDYLELACEMGWQPPARPATQSPEMQTRPLKRDPALQAPAPAV